MKGRGLLGIKAEEASGVHAFGMKNDELIHAEQIALRALTLAQKIYSRDPSFRGSLVNVHRLLREIYSYTVLDDEQTGQGMLKGETALKHCLEIYKLDRSDAEARSWLEKAETNTGEKFL